MSLQQHITSLDNYQGKRGKGGQISLEFNSTVSMSLQQHHHSIIIRAKGGQISLGKKGLDLFAILIVQQYRSVSNNYQGKRLDLRNFNSIVQISHQQHHHLIIIRAKGLDLWKRRYDYSIRLSIYTRFEMIFMLLIAKICMYKKICMVLVISCDLYVKTIVLFN